MMPRPPPLLDSVLFGLRALAVSLLGNGQDGGAVVDDGHPDDRIVIVETNAAYADRGPPHRAHVARLEADRHALLRAEQEILLVRRQTGGDDLVAVGDARADDAGRSRPGVFGERCLLHRAPARASDDEEPFGELPHGQDGGGLFVLGHLHDVDHRLAAGGTAAERKGVNLHPVDLAQVGEHQQVRVGGGSKQLFDESLLLWYRCRPPRARRAAALGIRWWAFA